MLDKVASIPHIEICLYPVDASVSMSFIILFPPQMCPQYWPAEVGDVMRLDALEVVMETEETIEDNIISRKFKITNTKNVSELK